MNGCKKGILRGRKVFSKKKKGKKQDYGHNQYKNFLEHDKQNLIV